MRRFFIIAGIAVSVGFLVVIAPVGANVVTGSAASPNPEAAENHIGKLHAAAEAGDAQAQYHLAICYANGVGVSKDSAEAVKWYRKAAEQGDEDQQTQEGQKRRTRR